MSDGGGASEREYNGLFDAVTCTARLTTNTMLQKANMDDDDAETALMPPMPNVGAPISSCRKEMVVDTTISNSKF